jgi:hypothetical protein
VSLLTLCALFVLLIIVLSALRTRLVYEIAGTSLLLSGSTRPGIWLYSLIMLPGTILHELSHWIVAEILQVKTGEITIMPELKGEGEREQLGSVATQRSDPFRGFLIGVAPFITGLLTLALLGSLLQTGWGVYSGWWIALIIYGIVVVGNSMMISKEDRRTWPFMIIFLTIVSVLLYQLQVQLPVSIAQVATDALSKINVVLGVTALLNLGMIGASYALRRIVERSTNKRIVHKQRR